jgi:hypothetical protein
MKAKVIIENGLTQIVLTPENDFERNVIEEAERQTPIHELKTSISTDYGQFGNRSNHKIIITIL